MKRKVFWMLAIASFIVSCTTTNPTNVESLVSPGKETSQTGLVAPAESVVKSGTFIAGEHPTTGTVQILNQNGQQSLVLGTDFKTSELGPDLVVILHRNADVLGSTLPPSYPLVEGSYVVLAPLRQFQGTQRYAIPANVNLSDYASVAIWCRKFNATFGTAPLR